MCLALPYRLTTLTAPGRALAEGPDGVREISTLALDAPRPGLHVLVAYGVAVREIGAEEADALLALLRALSGDEPERA
jgi:hydrogenase assembly chaperone HypC/HupF